MPDTPASLAERMVEQGHKTLEFFRLLSPEQWHLPIYTEGATWSVRDVLAHFTAAEAGITRLVENILGGGPGSPEDFDLNAYNERKVAGLKSVSEEELLLQFSQLREKSVALVKGLGQDDLVKMGRHPWLGIASVAEILKMIVLHNQIHQRDIRRAISSAGRNEDG